MEYVYTRMYTYTSAFVGKSGEVSTKQPHKIVFYANNVVKRNMSRGNSLSDELET